MNRRKRRQKTLLDRIIFNLKQYICKHDYERIAEHEHSQQNLWQCKKCEQYYIQHYGINCGYPCKRPNLGGWKKLNHKGETV